MTALAHRPCPTPPRAFTRDAPPPDLLADVMACEARGYDGYLLRAIANQALSRVTADNIRDGGGLGHPDARRIAATAHLSGILADAAGVLAADCVLSCAEQVIDEYGERAGDLRMAVLPCAEDARATAADAMREGRL